MGPGASSRSGLDEVDPDHIDLASNLTGFVDTLIRVTEVASALAEYRGEAFGLDPLSFTDARHESRSEVIGASRRPTMRADCTRQQA